MLGSARLQEHREDYFANRDGCHLHRGAAHHSGQVVGALYGKHHPKIMGCHKNIHAYILHPTKLIPQIALDFHGNRQSCFTAWDVRRLKKWPVEFIEADHQPDPSHGFFTKAAGCVKFGAHTRPSNQSR